jgi:DNA-directed RNA polymerase subunit B"
LIERGVLSRVYFGKEHVSRHQLDSFNNFLEHNLQKVVNEQKVIQTDIDSRGKSRVPVWVELGTITVEKQRIDQYSAFMFLVTTVEVPLPSLQKPTFVTLRTSFLKVSTSRK